MEQALATGESDSIDQLHREDLIPLAHALKRLEDCLLRPWPRPRGDVEQCLRSVRYLQGAVASAYGPIPWRVLPARPRAALLKEFRDTALLELCAEIFDAPPDERASQRAA